MKSAEAGYMYIWEYLVRPGSVPAFLEAYGPEGDWVRLFRGATGYRRTELHRDLGNPDRFVTIDYWVSRAAWEAWRAGHSSDWEALDARCEELTVSEREVGRFEPAQPADPPP